MDIFADKTVFIAGAACDLTWCLLPVLESANARAILMDMECTELMSMARRNVELLEPLPLRELSAANCKVVGEIWDAEPIDILIDMVSISSPQSGEKQLQISRTMLHAFEPALRAAEGCVISVVPKARRSDPVKLQVAEAGHLQLADLLAKRWADWSVTHNLLRPEKGASAASMAKAVDIAAQAGWHNFTGVHVPISATSY